MQSYLEEQGVAHLRYLYEHPEIEVACDTETTGLKVADGTHYCIGVSIAYKGALSAGSHYFGVAHPTGVNVSDTTFRMLKFVLEQPGRLLIWANVQFDVLSLETVDIRVGQQPFRDIMTIANLVDENRPFVKSLEQLAKHYLKIEQGKVDDAFVNAEKKSGNQNITPEQMFLYGKVDAEVTWRVDAVLTQHPEWTKLPPEIWETKQKVIRVLTEMRRRGVLINQELAMEQAHIGRERMEVIATELGEIAAAKGFEADKKGFNPGSNKQLKVLLIDLLGLPVVKQSKTTGAPSFAKDAMEEYEPMLERLQSPVARLLKEYRGWQKAVTASYEPYIKLVDDDGRLRCQYNTHRTVSGRLSCSEPNLQQIPKESDKVWNGRVKECFVAQPGYVLVEFDYSQLELRLGTAYAGEMELKQVFAEGRDIFDEMAAQLGMKRQDVKTLVYSMQYGAGEQRIMNVFGVTRQRAREIRQNYFDTYPKFKALSDYATNAAQRSLAVKLWTGRYRHFQYSSESYKALNSVIQGGAADIVERVMVRAFDEIDNPDCRLLLQVHDSLVWEIRADLVDDYRPRIQQLMQDVRPDFGVFFAVDAKVLGPKEEVAA